jgi:hypothetical protein
MTGISTFPTIQKVLVGKSGVIFDDLKAGETIKAGQVVAFAATGVSKTVVVVDATVGEYPIGVAIHDAASGELVTVAGPGCRVIVANADDTTGIDAGGLVEANSASAGGTVSEFTPRADLASTTIDATNDTTIDGHAYIVGRALEDIAGGKTGEILIWPEVILYSDHTVVS